MGMLKDFREEINSIADDISDDIQDIKRQPERRKPPEPGMLKKTSAAFVSGWYATRNMQRAQMGPAMAHMMHMHMPGECRPRDGGAEFGG